jgi:hypothetical protein
MLATGATVLPVKVATALCPPALLFAVLPLVKLAVRFAVAEAPRVVPV